MQADEAAVETAKFNLDNTKIRAPISGRTGGLLVREGNVVHAGGATPLVVINQISPITVRFPVPATDLPLIQKYSDSGKLPVTAVPGGARQSAQDTAGGPPGSAGGDTPQGRAEVNRWLALVNADIHPTFKPLFGATAYLEDAAMIERTKQATRDKLRTYYEQVDAQLDGRDWIAGTRSIADPYLLVTLRWARKFGVDLSGLANVERYITRMEDDPGVRAAERKLMTHLSPEQRREFKRTLVSLGTD